MVHVATPPDPRPKTPRLKLPPGAVDSHLHLFGPAERYPFHPDTLYQTGDALPEMLIAMHKAIGVSHGVIVNGGAYGRNSDHLMDTLARFPDWFRGVAVPPYDLPVAEIKRMHAAGVRGIRFVSDKGGKHVTRIDPDLAQRVHDQGWHVQFIGPKGILVDYADRLLALPNDIVIDHFGSVLAEQGVNQPAFQALLRMLDTGRVWVKMSGAYYCSRQPFPHRDIQPFADVLVRAASERLVWGTDWPHLHMHDEPMPNDGDLVDMLLDWVPDEATRNRILVDNPARLYDFPKRAG